MKKILILEDEEVLGRIYKKKLIEAGYQVELTTTLDQTQQVLQNFPADVILLDHGIRGYDRGGIDLVPSLRELHPDAKIIILSNYSTVELQEQALNSGADGYLIKINTPPKALLNFLSKLGDESSSRLHK